MAKAPKAKGSYKPSYLTDAQFVIYKAAMEKEISEAITQHLTPLIERRADEIFAECKDLIKTIKTLQNMQQNQAEGISVRVDEFYEKMLILFKKLKLININVDFDIEPEPPTNH